MLGVPRLRSGSDSVKTLLEGLLRRLLVVGLYHGYSCSIIPDQNILIKIVNIRRTGGGSYTSPPPLVFKIK